MTFVETFIDPILHNPVVTGLSFTAALGAVGYQLRRVPSLIEEALRRSAIVSVSVTNADPAFTWIERWLAAQPYAARAKSVILRSYDEDGDAPRMFASNSAAAPWALSPGEELHWFWWRGRLVWLERSRDAPPAAGTRRSSQVETIRLRTFGRTQATLRAIVEDAQQAARSKDIVTIRLWRGYWANVRGKRLRSLSTIVLAAGQAERIMAAVQQFEQSSAAYATRGIPWRMGLLFKGAPGTGKTSFVLALAAHLRRPICVLNLGSVDDDDALFSAVMDAPSDAIVLIEDIDCAGSAKTRKKEKLSDGVDDDEEPGVTKAGLLNALDGVTTPDGRIFVMTTNHPELLDPALVRPGRADLVEDFQFLGAAEQSRMASLHYGHGRFIPLPDPLSPAAMQAAFMRFPRDPAAARRMLQATASDTDLAAD